MTSFTDRGRDVPAGSPDRTRGVAPDPPDRTRGVAPDPPDRTRGVAPDSPDRTRGVAPDSPDRTRGVVAQRASGRGLRTSRPLDGIGSIKVKIGLLVALSILAAVVMLQVGSRAGVSGWLTLPVTLAAALGVTQLLARG